MSNGFGIKVHNANLDKVQYILEKMLQDNDKFCGCHRCRMDVSAIALNSLPPHYFVDHTRPESAELGSHWMLVEVAVKEAIERVFKYPNHKSSARHASNFSLDMELADGEAPDE